MGFWGAMAARICWPASRAATMPLVAADTFARHGPPTNRKARNDFAGHLHHCGERAIVLRSACVVSCQQAGRDSPGAEVYGAGPRDRGKLAAPVACTRENSPEASSGSLSGKVALAAPRLAGGPLVARGGDVELHARRRLGVFCRSTAICTVAVVPTSGRPVVGLYSGLGIRGCGSGRCSRDRAGPTTPV
jgi:hypothetical protein